MRVLMLHGVGGDDFPAADLRRSLAYLARHFDVVPLGTIVDRVLGSEPATGRELALTFDDGLRNNFAVAVPVLRDLGLPATFFVCPALIEDGRWLWNHEARARLKILRSEGVEDKIEWMKTLPLDQRRTEEEKLRAETASFAPTAGQRTAFDMASWQEIAALDPAQFTIGSHSLSHPILTTLSEADLRTEVAGSRERLEERLGRPVDLFCYPNGAEDEAVRACVAGAYRAAVTTEPGFVEADGDPFRLSRIGAVESLSTLTWRLHRP